MGRFAFPALALAVTITALAGCGGDEVSPEEQWAASVCSAVSTWKTEISTIASDTAEAVTKPAQARAALESAVDEGKQATEELVSDLKSLTPPDTPEGQQAKEQLDAFTSSVESTAEQAQAALSELSDASNLSDLASSLAGLASELQATVESGKELVATLESAGGAIKDGFENADSCDELRSGD